MSLFSFSDEEEVRTELDVPQSQPAAPLETAAVKQSSVEGDNDKSPPPPVPIETTAMQQQCNDEIIPSLLVPFYRVIAKTIKDSGISQ